MPPLKFNVRASVHAHRLIRMESVFIDIVITMLIFVFVSFFKNKFPIAHVTFWNHFLHK